MFMKQTHGKESYKSSEERSLDVEVVGGRLGSTSKANTSDSRATQEDEDKLSNIKFFDEPVFPPLYDIAPEDAGRGLDLFDDWKDEYFLLNPSSSQPYQNKEIISERDSSEDLRSSITARPCHQFARVREPLNIAVDPSTEMRISSLKQGKGTDTKDLHKGYQPLLTNFLAVKGYADSHQVIDFHAARGMTFKAVHNLMGFTEVSKNNFVEEEPVTATEIQKHCLEYVQSNEFAVHTLTSGEKFHNKLSRVKFMGREESLMVEGPKIDSWK